MPSKKVAKKKIIKTPVAATTDVLLSIVKHWQKILRLQDWDVSVVIVRRSEMQDRNNLAQNAVWTTSKISQIQIMHPEDWPADQAKQDVEADIIHELLHLHLDSISPRKGTPAWVTLEVAIELMSGALLGLKRAAIK